MTALRMFVFVYDVLFSVYVISYECEGKLFHSFKSPDSLSYSHLFVVVSANRNSPLDDAGSRSGT